MWQRSGGRVFAFSLLFAFGGCTNENPGSGPNPTGPGAGWGSSASTSTFENIDDIGSGITDPGTGIVPELNKRRRHPEELYEDTHSPTVPRPARILDPKVHGRDTRYPLFADQPQPQARNGNSTATSTIAELPVSNGKIDLSVVPAKHRQATERTWARVRYLLPPKHVANITVFEAWDGDSGASVWGETGKVTLGLTVNGVGNTDHTIIHEFGHQLSSLPSETKAPDGTYFKFQQRFHKDPVYIPPGVTKEFYEHFVTAYAATNDDEDFAEVFRYFVYLDKPQRSDKVVDQKILLLWEKPLFTEARAHIRKQLGI